MQSTTLSALGNAAIAYATRGFSVFPCVPRGKVPATPHGCRDATKDLAQITTWWCADPSYNVAAATGTVSKVFVLDVDGLDAASLRKLEDRYGTLPETVASITPRGSHLFFKSENGAVRNSASAIARGLDIRGDGGYVVLPPSIHPSGRPYVWSVDSADPFCRSAGLAHEFARLRQQPKLPSASKITRTLAFHNHEHHPQRRAQQHAYEYLRQVATQWADRTCIPLRRDVLH